MDRELVSGSRHCPQPCPQPCPQSCPQSCPNQEQKEQGQRDIMPPPAGHSSIQQPRKINCSDLWQMSQYRIQQERMGVKPHAISCDQTENPPRQQIMNMYPLLEKTRNLQKQQQFAENNDYDMSSLQPSDKQYQVKVEMHNTHPGGENIRY